MHSTRDKLRKALSGLVLYQPFFGSLALRLRYREDPGCATLWTDGTTCGFQPAFLEGLSLEETKGVLAHEVMHCALAHHARRNGRNPRRWNRAGDYVINEALTRGGFVLPAGALFNPAFADLSADEVYRLLPEEPEDGAPDGSPDPGGCGEVRDPAPGGIPSSPAQFAKAEREWKIAVSQAVTQARASGRLPGGFDRLLDEILTPRVAWAEVLRVFIQTAARNDYSWLRPSRSYLARGLYAPSLHSRELGEVVLAVDTSGSIGKEALAQFAAEVSAILDEYDTTVHVVYCDTMVGRVERFTRKDLPLLLHPAGGGGTDFRPPFAWVEQEEIEPACLVYLTDLHCRRYPPAPGYPVLWVHPAKNHGAMPPFGDTVPL
ncbi:MAG: VWA-like domain-containing protein [Desulfobacteraceae bacterium]|nr:VWA-like domain-containing protein [Desulfobacteraceae bacterium]